MTAPLICLLAAAIVWLIHGAAKRERDQRREDRWADLPDSEGGETD